MILYEMLVGQPPFLADTGLATQQKVTLGGTVKSKDISCGIVVWMVYERLRVLGLLK